MRPELEGYFAMSETQPDTGAMAMALRVEAASGADRELDHAIACMMVGNIAKLPVYNTPAKWIAAAKQYNWSSKYYTASIDAALTLVSPDYWIEIKGPRKYLNIPTPVPNYWSVQIATWNHESDVMGWGKTIALAICNAALKAKARAHGQGDGR
jgi:hypothetical protein